VFALAKSYTVSSKTANWKRVCEAQNLNELEKHADGTRHRRRNIMGTILCGLTKVRYAHYTTCLLALFGSAAVGQVNTASVTGTVTDPTGGAVPIAKVEATNQATNVTP
jgi:hypothetical protein